MPYTIQGLLAPISQEPEEINGCTYVPLLEITEALGGSVDWDSQGNVCEASIGPWEARIALESSDAEVSGTCVTFSAPPVDNAGSVWVPPDFFHRAFGYHVQVNGSEVAITNPNT